MPISKRVLGPLGIALLCWSQQASAFECPRMEKTGPGVLQETKQDEQALSQMFSGSDVESEIGIAVNDLQKKYPHRRVIPNWSTISSARIARLSPPCPT